MLALKRKKKLTGKLFFFIFKPVSSAWLTAFLTPGEGQIKQQEVQKSYLSL